MPNAERLALYLRTDELHQAFNFHYVKVDWEAAQFRQVIDESLTTVAKVGAPPTWVLSNHDIVRHVTRFGSVRRARAAALLTFALPGCTYVYQGEELGLPEVTDLPEEAIVDPRWERSGHTVRGRDGCRVPLPWSGDRPPFGFSATSSWLPQPESWADLTAEAQQADESSMLSLYRRALLLRPAIRGDFGWADAPDGVLSFRRGNGFLCTVNFTGSPITVSGGELLMSSVPMEGNVLPPDSAAWWRVARR